MLFDAKLISPQVQAALPAGFIVRPLDSSDYEKGFLKTLEMLTIVGPLSKYQFTERYSYMEKHNDEYFVIVIEDTKKGVIVGSGTILVFLKLTSG